MTIHNLKDTIDVLIAETNWLRQSAGRSEAIRDGIGRIKASLALLEGSLPSHGRSKLPTTTNIEKEFSNDND
jgi:hypothetical protein